MHSPTWYLSGCSIQLSLSRIYEIGFEFKSLVNHPQKICMYKSFDEKMKWADVLKSILNDKCIPFQQLKFLDELILPSQAAQELLHPLPGNAVMRYLTRL